MTPEQFTYWLQGFIEPRGNKANVPPTQEEWDSIREHLKTVFNKITPQVGAITPQPYIPQSTPVPFPLGIPGYPGQGPGGAIC